VPARSSLNWGQRPEEGREPNQAYLPVNGELRRSTFFPDRGLHFSVTTDDGKTFLCCRAQDENKAIHTPHNNSEFGVYFRQRLMIPLGSPVTKNDLLRYGRTTVDFYKLDDETFILDFSVNTRSRFGEGA